MERSRGFKRLSWSRVFPQALVSAQLLGTMRYSEQSAHFVSEHLVRFHKTQVPHFGLSVAQAYKRPPQSTSLRGSRCIPMVSILEIAGEWHVDWRCEQAPSCKVFFNRSGLHTYPETYSTRHLISNDVRANHRDDQAPTSSEPRVNAVNRSYSSRFQSTPFISTLAKRETPRSFHDRAGTDYHCPRKCHFKPRRFCPIL